MYPAVGHVDTAPLSREWDSGRHGNIRQEMSGANWGMWPPSTSARSSTSSLPFA